MIVCLFFLCHCKVNAVFVTCAEGQGQLPRVRPSHAQVHTPVARAWRHAQETLTRLVKSLPASFTHGPSPAGPKLRSRVLGREGCAAGEVANLPPNWPVGQKPHRRAVPPCLLHRPCLVASENTVHSAGGQQASECRAQATMAVEGAVGLVDASVRHSKHQYKAWVKFPLQNGLRCASGPRRCPGTLKQGILGSPASQYRTGA